MAGLALSGCASQSGSGGASAISDVEGQTAYTQRNMWFHEGVHKTTNYHVSTLLPVNSQVTITDTSSERIMLKTSDGTEYTIVNIAEYNEDMHDVGVTFH